MSKDTENKIGRPTAMTPEVISDLKKAFGIGATQREACAFAGIALSTLQLYMKKDPDFSEQVTNLQHKPVLKARQVVVDGINKGDKQLAWDYLQKKNKDEFGKRVEMTGADGKDLPSLQVEFIGVDKDDG